MQFHLRFRVPPRYRDFRFAPTGSTFRLPTSVFCLRSSVSPRRDAFGTSSDFLNLHSPFLHSLLNIDYWLFYISFRVPSSPEISGFSLRSNRFQVPSPDFGLPTSVFLPRIPLPFRWVYRLVFQCLSAA